MEIFAQVLGLALGFLLVLLYFLIEEATEEFTEKLTWNSICNEFSAFPLGFLVISILFFGFLYTVLYILEDVF